MRGEKVTMKFSSVENLHGKSSSCCLPPPYLPVTPVTITEMVVLCFGGANRGLYRIYFGYMACISLSTFRSLCNCFELLTSCAALV